MYAKAVKALSQGDVVAVPTEAVYGLSGDPHNLTAVQTILDLKQRNPDKGFILVASDFSQLEPFIEPLSPEVYQRVMATWPGPHTWVVPARASVSSLLRGKHTTIAVRITAHPVMAGLCKEFNGALVSTSANIEGKPPALTEQDVQQIFGKDVFVVPGALGDNAQPTSIKDALTGHVIR